MICLRYSNKNLKILDEFTINNSSREVTFNDLDVDFTGYTINDLPTKYQEVQIVELSESTKREEQVVTRVYFTGYVLSYKLPELHNTWEDRTLSITLVSPYEMATLRTTSLIGTNKLSDALNLIVKPLLDDGFIIKEINVSSSTVTTGYMLETIETCLNDLSNKYNFWWYIDENKNIFFYDLDYLFSKQVTNRYNLSGLPYGLSSISPSMDATDYCNVINFKNVRVYSPSVINDTLNINPLVEGTEIKLNKGDAIEFNFPFDITIKNVQKSIENNALSDFADTSLNDPFIFKIKSGTSTIFEASIKLQDDKLVYNNVDFEGTTSTTENTTPILLKRDSFFSNLITGFTYNGESSITGTIEQLSSCSGLKWTKLKFINNSEIEKCKGVISKSGRIEKTVDLGEVWRTESELKELAVSYLKLNKSQTDELKLEMYNKPDFGIGDIVYFNLDEFFTNNNYIVTDTSWNYVNDNDQTWTISLRNKNYLANFIDVFRGESFENDDEKDVNMIVVNYVNEELFERHEVV